MGIECGLVGEMSAGRAVKWINAAGRSLYGGGVPGSMDGPKGYRGSWLGESERRAAQAG